jgi:hypothetical protein
MKWQLMVDGKAITDISSWDLMVLAGVLETITESPSTSVSSGRFELQSYLTQETQCTT